MPVTAMSPALDSLAPPKQPRTHLLTTRPPPPSHAVLHRSAEYLAKRRRSAISRVGRHHSRACLPEQVHSADTPVAWRRMVALPAAQRRSRVHHPTRHRCVPLRLNQRRSATLRRSAEAACPPSGVAARHHSLGDAACRPDAAAATCAADACHSRRSPPWSPQHHPVLAPAPSSVPSRPLADLEHPSLRRSSALGHLASRLPARAAVPAREAPLVAGPAGPPPAEARVRDPLLYPIAGQFPPGQVERTGHTPGESAGRAGAGPCAHRRATAPLARRAAAPTDYRTRSQAPWRVQNQSRCLHRPCLHRVAAPRPPLCQRQPPHLPPQGRVRSRRIPPQRHWTYLQTSARRAPRVVSPHRLLCQIPPRRLLQHLRGDPHPPSPACLQSSRQTPPRQMPPLRRPSSRQTPPPHH